MTGVPAGDEQFARNLIGGRWQFPAVPFEYEIRSPLDGTVLAAVPLSSRLDVARAVRAAATAKQAWAADPDARRAALARLADALTARTDELAELQAAETGLDPPDSAFAAKAAVDLAARLLGAGARASGVTGHVLSWGLPLTEVICSVLPRLAAGQTAVVKPSLRAPLSATAFAHLATEAGLPAGVLNLVQGTGTDVGAALLGEPCLRSLHVRASERTLADAVRAAARTGARLVAVRSGGNVHVAGRDADPEQVAMAATATLALHSAGGLGYLPLLCAQETRAPAIAEAIAARLPMIQPAPLPAEPLRQRALARIEQLGAAGARLVHGGAVPDDARHRMGWIIPPALLDLGHAGTPAATAALASEPLGPVLLVLTWRTPDDLDGIFTHPRYADGAAFLAGVSEDEIKQANLPHKSAPG